MDPITIGLLGSTILSGLFGSSAAQSQEDISQEQLDLQKYIYEQGVAASDEALANQLRIAQGTDEQMRDISHNGYDAQQLIYDQTLANQNALYQPYYDTGVAANDVLAYELGYGEMPTGYTGFEGTPGYEYVLDETTGAIEGSAASAGGLMSGATMEDLQSNAQGLASQDYYNYLNALGSQQAVGVHATDAMSGNQGAWGANSGNARAGLTTNLYNSAANSGASRTNSYGAWAGNIMGAGNSYAAGAMPAYDNMGNAQAAAIMAPVNALNTGMGQYIGYQNYNTMMAA